MKILLKFHAFGFKSYISSLISIIFWLICSICQDPLKMGRISRICQSQVPLSSLILGVQPSNIKITAMWYRLDITVHQRLYWVILFALSSILSVLSYDLWLFMGQHYCFCYLFQVSDGTTLVICGVWVAYSLNFAR